MPSRFDLPHEDIPRPPGVRVKAQVVAIGVRPPEVIKALMDRIVFASMNSYISHETAKAVAREFGCDLDAAG